MPATSLIRCTTLLAAFCTSLLAGGLTVTVRDPAKALVAAATVDIAPQTEDAHRTKPTDSSGRATFDPLPVGTCRVTVTKQGFTPWEGVINIADKTVSLPVTLTLSTQSSSVRVSARRSPLANSDPNYQLLRTGKLTKVYRVSNLTLTRDAGTFTFHSGSFSFLPPVQGHVTTGVFVGEGNFRLKPEGELAALRLKRWMGAESVDEDFIATVIFFSDATFDEIKEHSEVVDESAQTHEEALKSVRNVIEGRRPPRLPPSWPRSQLEILLNWEDIPNYDAEILAEIYNGQIGEKHGSFRAFMHGKKYPDLRFLVNPHGAMPILKAPEEVALIHFNPNSNADGIWYLSHTLPELQSGGANSKEEKRLLAPEHYKIDAVLGSPTIFSTQPDLAVTCELTFHALEDGIRMVKFDLMPDLQVARVNWNGSEIAFVQESRNHDGTFYLQLPEALTKGRTYNATFEYAGGEIVQSSFGNVPPNRIWYPTPAGPASRATYDLTYRIPQGSKIVTVGNQVSEARAGFWDMSQWTTDVPITQAVFTWVRDATLKTEVEETTKSRMSLYANVPPGAFIQPPSADYMLGDVGNALRLFHSWFGKPAYDSIAVLVGGGGASLPGLVYTPSVFMVGAPAIAARVGDGLRPQIRTILNEGFPRLIAGQWWENTLSPASLHDAWLAEGLNWFSASVYDLAADNNTFRDRWTDAREVLLLKNKFGVRPNDAGPVWMGMLNNTPVTPGASFALNASKGAYIVEMLRSMMWDPQTLDRDFQAMLQDFVATFMNQSVSSEDFESTVEKHMKPAMDLGGDRTMKWFFSEWLYGTDVPSYRLEYSLKPGQNGDTLLEGTLTQSGVSPNFRMLVPVYAELANKNYRIAQVSVQGNSSVDVKAAMSARPNKILLNVNHDILSDKDEIIQPKSPAR